MADPGATGWDFQTVLPFFRKLEGYKGGESQFRRSFGELKVDDLRLRHPACEAWLKAAIEWGLPPIDDFNGSESFGSGRYQLTLDGRWRSSSARAFLHPIAHRENLTVVSDTLVEKITFSSKRATGIVARRNGVQETYQAKKIVMSAGALQSPLITSNNRAP